MARPTDTAFLPRRPKAACGFREEGECRAWPLA
jgi:hypothetical protein